MVAHVLRLRATLLLGALRGRPAQIARVVAGLVLLVVATIIGCWALLSLADAPTDVAGAVIVAGGSALTFGCALAPLVGDLADPLDPRRFAVLAPSARSLAGVLALAGFVSVPILALIALAACTVLVWTAHGVPAAAAGFGALGGVVTCVLLARVSMAVAALVLRERRSRELSGLFVLAIVVVVVPAGLFLASLEWAGRVPTQLDAAVAALAASPIGAAWALPAQLAEGATAWFAGVVAVLTLVLLWWAWTGLVTRLLTTTERPASVRQSGGLGWFAVAPSTASGVIAARSMVYWLRDRRYLVNILVIPVAGALATLPLLIAGVPAPIVALVPVPIIALFFGWLPHNDVAYDSTAIWMHVASGTRGIADRVGRLVPNLLIATPLLAILIPVAIMLHDRWALLPAMVGVCASLFLSGLGLSSIASVLTPYPVSRPGDSPFQQPQNAGRSGAVAQGLVLAGALVVSAPTLWWGWLALTSDIRFATQAFWAGLAIGVGVLLLGLAIGSLAFGRRATRLMEFAEAS